MKKIVKQIAEIKEQHETSEIKAERPDIEHPKSTNDRRSFIKKAALGGIALGGLTHFSLQGVQAQTTQKVPPNPRSRDSRSLKDLKYGLCPKGKLGNLTVSRMMMGCNPFIGHSHGRDLSPYVNKLISEYNTEQKILETIHLGVLAGINTFVMTTDVYEYINKYNDIYNSKIQGICMAGLPKNDLLANINKALEFGPTSIYIHGRVADAYIKDGQIDQITKAMEHIRSQGLQAGMGAHCIETVEACEELKIPLDYYLKTFHHDQYWSALPEEYRDDPYICIGPSYLDHNKYHDNMWDLFPKYTVEAVKKVQKPLIGFKVLAAGAIQPQDGFRYAFENGADFIIVGMYDWQVIDNVNTVNEILGNLKNRERKWFS